MKTYKSLPALWKVKSEEYMNRDMETEAYKVILRLYQEKYPLADKEEVKENFNSLRTNFRKEFKKKMNHSKSQVLGRMTYESTFWYFKEILFFGDDSVSTIVVEDDTDTIDEMMDDFDSFNVAEKTARYLRLSVNTVRRYYNKKIHHVETPGKIRKKQSRPGVSVETLDDFTRYYVRQVIYRMYHEGKHVLMNSILLVIRTTGIDFHGELSASTEEAMGQL
uniref:(California timema) hypothetical protein n=1 Tax=Timema californicum TaxID=61474 RepID=A0A7R9J3B4_TIMCA|nr:unnamed protein product [Timema californicum]